MMLYRTLKRLIENGSTEGLSEKVDVFYACGKITKEQYTELQELLNNN